MIAFREKLAAKKRELEWEDETNDLTSDLCDLQRGIASQPGATLAEALSKLRLQATTNEKIARGYVISDADAYVEDGDVEDCLFLSALRDIERLMQKDGAA